jgi:cytochrome c biogenesis protein CcdA
MMMQGAVELAIFLAGAFTTGLYVALSPCLFPLLPLFLIRSLNATDSRKQSVLVTGVLVLGLITSLAVLSLVTTVVQAFLLNHFTNLQAVIGGIIVFFGILTMSETLRKALHLSSLAPKVQPGNPKSLAGVFLVGLGYSFMAAPCAFSAIVAIPIIFGVQSNPFNMILMFIFLSIGISIPYLAIAVVTGEGRTRMAMNFQQHTRKVEILAGILLIAIGIILILPAFGITLLY